MAYTLKTVIYCLKKLKATQINGKILPYSWYKGWTNIVKTLKWPLGFYAF